MHLVHPAMLDTVIKENNMNAEQNKAESIYTVK